MTQDLTSTSTCLTVNVSGITIDGGGHRITAAQFAIQWVDQSGITVKNVVSDQAIQIYGGKASHNVVTDSTFGSIAVYRGDDNVIQNSRIGKLVISGQSNDPAQREVVTGNVIERTLTKSEEKLVVLNTGTDGGTEPDGTYRCGRGEHLVTNNTMIGTVVATDPATEPELLHIKCGKFSTISGNTIRSGQRAVGILLRDGADENLIENNDVEVGDGNEGALFLQSGSYGFHHPRDNTFRGNLFRADRGRVFWIQAGATRGNTFLYNLFRTDDGTAESVRLTDGPGVTTLFEHNTFYRASVGSLLVFRNLGQGTNIFTSNIFAYPGGPYGIFHFDKPQSFAGYQGDYNAFFNSNGFVTFTQYGANLDLWGSYTNQDANSVEADPGFVSPESGNFELGLDSAVRSDGANGTDPGASPVAP